MSPAGWEYAERLKDFVLERRAKSLEARGLDPSGRRLVVSASPSLLRHDVDSFRYQIWTSTRRRSHHTAWPFLAAAAPIGASGEKLEPPADTPVIKMKSPALNVKVMEKQQMSEINPGIWDGLSPDQARKYYPEDWERFVKDPYAFRVPRAESYHDVSGMVAVLSLAMICTDTFDSASGANSY